MKTPSLFVILLGATLVALPVGSAWADDTTTNAAPAAPAMGASDGTGPNAQRREKLKAALAQLDLTDAQKDQIKQIRATVADKKERRQQIMAVLTPDQKAKLVQMIREHREDSGVAAAPAPSAN